MVEIFWDGFDKYGQLYTYPVNSTMGNEWTSLPSGNNASFVMGRFPGSLALQIMDNDIARRSLANNYARLIGGIAMQSNLQNSSGVVLSDSGSSQCAIGFNSAGNLVLWQGGINGTQIDITSSPITANSWHYVEWDLTFSSSGNYSLWLDGVLAFSGVGNLRTSGNSTANTISLSGHIINFDDMYLFDSTGSTNNAQRGDSRIETLFPTADASVAFAPSQGVIGAYYSINGLNGYLSANQLYLRKYTAPVSGTLNSISVMPNQSSGMINFKPAIYADNVGSPGTLLSSGAAVNGCVGGTPVVMPLTTPQSLTAGTPYWLGYVTDTDLNTLRQDAAAAQTNSGYQAGISYTSGPPSTAPSMGSGNSSLMVWGNMTGMSTNYTETSEMPPGGDLSCVASSTVGAEDLYNFTSLSSAPSNIAGVKISTLLRKTDSGARTVSVQLKSGSTEVSSAAVTASSSYTYYTNYQDTDPDTSAAWTASGINSLAAGAKIAS
jgi:hypothetical protein